MTGFWKLDDAQQLDAFKPTAELKAFLADGPTPIYVGWGSMLVKDGAPPARPSSHHRWRALV